MNKKSKKFNPMSNEQRRHLFWLFKQYGIEEETRNAMICEWTSGRASRMSELGFIDALEIIKYLKSLSQTPREKKYRDTDKMDKKRKGLIKAVFSWLELQGKDPSMDYVLGVICKAGGVDYINDLTEVDLQRLYAEFCKKQKAQIEMNQEQIIRFSNN